MPIAKTRATAINRADRDLRRASLVPSGLAVVVPGWLQFSWGQRERGWVLAGSFSIAIAVGLWTWGTLWCWVFFAFAYVTQVTSIIDVLRQISFPTYPRRAALVFVSSALAVLVYLPSLLILSEVARPGFEPDRTRSGFLVNCWAYHGEITPHQGQWIWMRFPSALGEQRAARVVAVPGQEVEWNGHHWNVDGHEFNVHPVLRVGASPQICRFKVPPHQVLVEPDDESGQSLAAVPLVLVPPHAIIGRAWAQFYPVWDRHLL